MRKSKLTILLILITILVGCKKENLENIQNPNSKKIELYSKKIEPSKLKPKITQTGINLTVLKEIPKEIDGCSCIFSETENKFKAQEYLIATNLDSIAYISINHNIIKLKLIEKKIDSNSKDDDNLIEIFANEKYKATIEVKKDKTKKVGDEVWWNIGSIKIENKNGESQTKKFVGECGC